MDKIALGTISALSLTISILVWGTNACGTECLFRVQPQVENFSWQDRKIGASDRAFLLDFNRPVDRDSIENNLSIDPPLEGSISWAGNRLAYTLKNPAPYGEQYRISLLGGQQQYVGEAGEQIKPFVSEFSTKDRAFAYIGSEGKRQGRLMLYNWTQQNKEVLTPEHLVVIDFEPYPSGDQILFSATEKNQDISQLQLYSVSLNRNQNEQDSQPQIKLVLDSEEYQNNQFDLAQDGKTIIVQRIHHHNLDDFGLWKIAEGQEPQALAQEAVGEFAITPDSQALAVAQGEGIALLPLDANAESLDFLPQFGRVVSFSADGRAAAMVDYNQDDIDLRYTKSLFYVNNQGIQKELLNLEGSIVDCQFTPTGQDLYCLLTELQEISDSEQVEYQEKPYLVNIELKTGEITPLLTLPDYQDSKLSMAPDGLGILFDQVLRTDTSAIGELADDNADVTTIKSRLWLLIPPSSQSDNYQVEQLPLIGFRPQWIP